MHTTPDSIISILQKKYSDLRKHKTISIILTPIILLGLWITGLIFLEQTNYFSVTFKSIYLFLALALATFSVLLIRNRITIQSFTDFYRAFGSSHDVKELNYAIDLSKSATGNPQLIQAAIEDNLNQVASQDLQSKLNSYLKDLPLYKLSRLIQTISVVSIFSLVLAITFNLESSSRALSFWKCFDKPNPFLFSVSPGNQNVEQGSSVSISVDFSSFLKPDDVQLALKTSIEDDFRFFNMVKNEDAYQSLPIELNSNSEYYIQMDDFKSENFSINVQLRPRFNALTLNVQSPAYTKQADRSYSYPFSEINPVKGSKINIVGQLNKEVEEFTLNSVLVDSFEVDYSQDQKTISINYNVDSADTLYFDLADSDGLENSNPFTFIISPDEDAYPFVDLFEPRSNLELVDPKNILIGYNASDDFGLSKVQFVYQLTKAFTEGSEPIRENIQIPTGNQSESFTWEVDSLQLGPQDRVDFWIEATDNDGISGYKTSKSQILALNVPSLVDYFEEVNELEDSLSTDLENIAEEFEDLSNQFEELKEELRDKPQSAWEQKNEVEEIKDQKSKIEEQLEELNEKFDELKDELKDNQTLSDETMEAYDELQKLLEEIDDPALMEALEELQKSLDSFSPEQLRKALEEVEFNEEAYKERLERTLELFKQLKTSSNLEKIAKAAEDLADQQKEQSENGENASEASKENTQDQIEKLEKQIEDLEKDVTDQIKESVEDFQKEAKEELDQAKENMDQSEGGDEQPSDQQNQNQQNQQQSPEQNFRNVAEQARQTMEQINQEQNQVNIAGINYVLYSLINISEEQEDLNQRSRQANSRSQAFIEYAREQKNLDLVFESVSDSLSEIAKDTPALSNEVLKKKLNVEKDMGQALNQLAERDSPKASVATRQVLGGVNDLAFLLANLLEQMQDSQNGGQGSGGSPSQQMQQMMQGQDQINQQLQELINDLQGNKLTQDQTDRLKQLSKQQNQLRKQLQQMQQDGTFTEGDKVGSELERIIEEMEETINDIRGGAIDQIMIERQQNILSRMLEAEKALDERDEEEKREGKTADPTTNPTPPNLTLEELEKEIRNRLNDPNFTKFSPDYQRLIETYFELLKKLNTKEL